MKRIFSILFVLVLAVSLMLVPAALVGASPGPGLVSQWHFDGDANDSSGNDNHGTVYGATYVSGKFGQALSFDGVDDRVEVSHSPSLNISGTAITLEAWINANTFPASGRVNIISKVHAYALQVSDGGKVRVWLGPLSYVETGVELSTGTWHHIAGTYDGSNVRIYVDGGLKKTVAKTGNQATFTSPVVIGKRDPGAGGGNQGVFDGLIDEVRIWDEAVNPVTVSLRAGQHMDAGTVTVWNDSTDLHVEYQTSGDWCLTETHLHVAATVDGIPQKNGNPIPGQFDYPMEHDCATAYTYTIPLSWTPCNNVYIAAHAEVQKLSDVMTASLASGDDTDSVLVIAENTTDPGYPLGYPGPYSDTPSPAVVIQGTEAAYSGWPTITGAQWISDSTVDPGIVNSWRLFARNFSLPSNATNISGTLHIDSDNAEKAKINGSPADGLVYGDVYGGFTDDGEWNWVQHWPVGSYLQPGPNTLEVMVRNYYWEPTPGMWNYTGLVYKMDYEYQLLTTETAWGDGLDFDGKNWATYFMYHVQ